MLAVSAGNVRFQVWAAVRRPGTRAGARAVRARRGRARAIAKRAPERGQVRRRLAPVRPSVVAIPVAPAVRIRAVVALGVVAPPVALALALVALLAPLPLPVSRALAVSVPPPFAAIVTPVAVPAPRRALPPARRVGRRADALRRGGVGLWRLWARGQRRRRAREARRRRRAVLALRALVPLSWSAVHGGPMQLAC